MDTSEVVVGLFIETGMLVDIHDSPLHVCISDIGCRLTAFDNGVGDSVEQRLYTLISDMEQAIAAYAVVNGESDPNQRDA